MDSNFDQQMSLSKSKCWYSNNCWYFIKRVVPFPRVLFNIITRYLLQTTRLECLQLKKLYNICRNMSSEDRKKKFSNFFWSEWNRFSKSWRSRRTSPTDRRIRKFRDSWASHSRKRKRGGCRKNSTSSRCQSYKAFDVCNFCEKPCARLIFGSFLSHWKERDRILKQPHLILFCQKIPVM